MEDLSFKAFDTVVIQDDKKSTKGILYEFRMDKGADGKAVSFSYVRLLTSTKLEPLRQYKTPEGKYPYVEICQPHPDYNKEYGNFSDGRFIVKSTRAVLIEKNFAGTANKGFEDMIDSITNIIIN